MVRREPLNVAGAARASRRRLSGLPGLNGLAGISVTDRLLKGAKVSDAGGGSMVRGQLGWTRGSLAPGARATYSFSPDAGERGSVATSIGPTADGDSADPATGEGSITVTSGK